MKDPRHLVVFDLETTGFGKARIVEIGAVKFTPDGTVIDDFDTLVNPGIEIPERAIEVHGIKNADVVGMPGLEEIINDFFEFIDDPAANILIAHYAQFDTGILCHELGRIDVPWSGHSVYCSHKLAKARVPDLRGYKLGDLATYFSLTTDKPHRALADCYLTKDLWLKLWVPGDPLAPYRSQPVIPVSKLPGS